jgi:hypothetical protein
MAKTATSGTCQAQGQKVGASCDPSHETAADCDSTLELYCDAVKANKTFHTCLQAAKAGPGKPCGTVNGVYTQCTGASVCEKLASTGDAGTTSVCVARAADGASCDTVTGPACMAPARCIGTQLDGGTSGKCTLPDTTPCQ